MNFNSFYPQTVLTFFLAALLTCLVYDYAYANGHGGVVRAHFLNVGYGDAIYVELPEQDSKINNILIDAGDPEFSVNIQTYLSELGVKRISHAVITHGHKNHFGGYFDLLDTYSFDKLFINGNREGEEGYTDLLTLFDERFIPVETVQRGDALGGLPDGVQIRVLHPDKLVRNPNDNSIVLWLQYKSVSILFTGDVGAAVQKELIDLYGFQDVDVVQVPHHGGPVTDELAAAFRGKTFIMSTGENPWGWPKAGELTKLQGTLYRTDRHQTIIIETDGVTFSVRTPDFLNSHAN